MERNQNSRERNFQDNNRRDGQREGQRDGQRSGQGQRYNQNQRGGQGQRGNQRKGPRRDAPKRASIINLANYKDKQIRLTFSGVHDSREVTGYLKGYDQLMNLVLDDAEETLKSTEKRTLGRVIVRGPKLVSLALADGSEEVANPFTQNEEAEENRV